MSLVDNLKPKDSSRLASLIGTKLKAMITEESTTTLLNNPFNLERGKNYTWKGEMPSKGRFAKFSSVAWSVRAFYKTMRTYRKRGLNTIDSIFSVYAPEMSDSDLTVYKHDISDLMRMVGNFKTLTSQITDDDLPALASAVAARESGLTMPLTYFVKIYTQLQNEK